MTEKSEARSSGARADGSADWSALMARAQDGDRIAYRRLLEQVTPYLRALVARQGGLSGEIEDVVQDILLTLHAVRHTYDANRPFGPWLLAIARRRMADRLRDVCKRAAAETSLEPRHETNPAPGPNLYRWLLDRRALSNAIGMLPPRQRQAVLLLKLRGLSLKEAASESGMSITALKVASHRGVKALRAVFGKGA